MTHIKDGGKLYPLKILGITRRKCKTPVYNLAVDEDESYIANGIVVHNCRSTLIPLGPGDDIDEFDFITAKDAAHALELSSSAFGGTGRYSEEQKSEGVGRSRRDNPKFLWTLDDVKIWLQSGDVIFNGKYGKLKTEFKKKKFAFNPDQPRAPNGSPIGGQWVESGMDGEDLSELGDDAFDGSGDAYKYNEATGKVFSKAISTSLERGAIKGYTASQHVFINRDLRSSQALSRETSPFVEGIDSYISKSTVVEDVIVYRGFHLSGLKSAVGRSDVGALEGAVIEDRGYVSTSLRRSVARAFAWSDAEQEAPVLARILVPKGVNAAFVAPLITGIGREEAEVILPRGSKFLVVKDETKTIKDPETGRVQDVRSLDLRLVPPKTTKNSEEVPSRKGRLYLEGGERYDYYAPDQKRHPAGDESGGEFESGAGNPNSGPKVGPKNKLKKVAAGKKKTVSTGVSPGLVKAGGGLSELDGDDWADPKFGITADEGFVLSDYTFGGYFRLNAALRRGKLTKDLQKYKETLESALSKLPPRPGKTYRGASLSDEQIAKYRRSIGKTVTDPAFVSTSMRRSSAVSADDYQEGRPSSVLFEIHGKSGRSVDKYSLTDNEHEILFRPNTKFKIKSHKERVVRDEYSGYQYDQDVFVLEEVVTKTKKNTQRLFYSPDQARKPSGDESGGEFAPGAGNPNSGLASKTGPKNKLKRVGGGKKKATMGKATITTIGREGQQQLAPKFLKPNHIAALNIYAGVNENNAFSINGNLREERELSDVQKKAVIGLDDAFNMVPPLQHSIVVYRGLSNFDEIRTTWREGAGFFDQGYTSTAIDVESASAFAGGAGGRGMLLEITIPKGSRVLNIEELAGSLSLDRNDTESQREILLPRNSQFRISKVGKEKIKLMYIGSSSA